VGQFYRIYLSYILFSCRIYSYSILLNIIYWKHVPYKIVQAIFYCKMFYNKPFLIFIIIKSIQSSTFLFYFSYLSFLWKYKLNVHLQFFKQYCLGSYIAGSMLMIFHLVSHLYIFSRIPHIPFLLLIN